MTTDELARIAYETWAGGTARCAWSVMTEPMREPWRRAVSRIKQEVLMDAVVSLGCVAREPERPLATMAPDPVPPPSPKTRTIEETGDRTVFDLPPDFLRLAHAPRRSDGHKVEVRGFIGAAVETAAFPAYWLSGNVLYLTGPLPDGINLIIEYEVRT